MMWYEAVPSDFEKCLHMLLLDMLTTSINSAIFLTADSDPALRCGQFSSDCIPSLSLICEKSHRDLKQVQGRYASPTARIRSELFTSKCGICLAGLKFRLHDRLSRCIDTISRNRMNMRLNSLEFHTTRCKVTGNKRSYQES